MHQRLEPSPPKRPLPAGINKRCEQRIPRAGSVQVFPCPDGILGTSMRAKFVDFSASGVCLTCYGRLPLGAEFILRMEQPTGGPLMRLFKVVRVENAGASAYLVAGRFVRELKPVSTTPGGCAWRGQTPKAALTGIVRARPAERPGDVP